MEYDELVVDQAGAFVGKRSERVRVSVRGTLICERPLHGLAQVLIASSGVSVSSDVVQECAQRNIPIVFLAWNGSAYARIVAPGLTGTVRTRREQLLAYGDARGVRLAQAFALGKLSNQATLLRYLVKNYRNEPDLYDVVREAALRIGEDARAIAELGAASVELLREPLMVVEAQAAKRYWDASRRVVEREEWTAREGRGADDLVNSCLNYGYGCLYSRIEHAIILAGLDPYAGFIHADRAGKPSLVLDLIEEFRQPVVDRTVYGLLNKGAALTVVDGRLTDETRRTLAQRISERLEAQEPHEGKRYTIRTIIQMQARRVAAHVRAESEYKPWLSRW